MKITIKVRAAKRRSKYERGVEFIALNFDFGRNFEDNPADDPAVLTLAHAFNVPPIRVARDVRRCFDQNIRKDRS